MARGKRGVKFPGRANGEGRRPSFSDASAGEEAHKAAVQLADIAEVSSSLDREEGPWQKAPTAFHCLSQLPPDSSSSQLENAPNTS